MKIIWFYTLEVIWSINLILIPVFFILYQFSKTNIKKNDNVQTKLLLLDLDTIPKYKSFFPYYIFSYDDVQFLKSTKIVSFLFSLMQNVQHVTGNIFTLTSSNLKKNYMKLNTHFTRNFSSIIYLCWISKEKNELFFNECDEQNLMNP